MSRTALRAPVATVQLKNSHRPHKKNNMVRPRRLGPNATSACPLKRPDQLVFVLFSMLESGAPDLCKLLNRHPEVSCDGDVFRRGKADKSGPADLARARLGFTYETQRSQIDKYLGVHFHRCRARACGITVLPNQLSNSLLIKLLPPGCGVQKISLERANASALYDALHLSARPPNGYGSSMPLTRERFAKAKSDWYNRVGKLASGRSPSYKLTYEDLKPEAHSKAHASPSARLEAVLFDLSNFLKVHREDQICLLERCTSTAFAGAKGYKEVAAATNGTKGARTSKLVAHGFTGLAGAPLLAVSHAPDPAKAGGGSRGGGGGGGGSRGAGGRGGGGGGGGGGGRGARNRRVVVAYAAGITFVAVTIAGFCLAFGVAIGQTIPRLKRLKRYVSERKNVGS